MRITDSSRAGQGFTLVEVLIVVVILGVLAAIVIPQFASAADEARYNAFVTDLDTFTQGMIHYAAVGGGYAPDGDSGVLPAPLEPYMNKEKFEHRTPLGGVWDIEYNESGITSAIGVHFQSGNIPSDQVMSQIDSMIDDGDLTTGSFRKLAADRFYAILY